ncbi:MAG: metalloregulator ArsR/SmtB family transcription factor [Chthoniobacter sp.]|uniref:ArsR/SmtB family transcription factor n=1 Tax=Chthoniobacter sp. TaxID=2510640 RepID=UPI0032AD78B3
MNSLTQPPARQNRAALEKIAHSFRALSEPTRLLILQELKSGSKTVNELVEAIGTSQPNISKQLRVLFDGGFITKEQKGIFVHYEMQGDFVLRLCDLVCDRLNQQARASLTHYSI